MQPYAARPQRAKLLSHILLGTLALLLSTPFVAQAQTYTFAPFSVTAPDTNNVASVQLTGATSGTVYTSYSVSLNWSAISGNPWQDEAIWAFVNTPASVTTGNVFYADPGSSPVAQSNGTSGTLTWSGFMDTNYVGGTPLYFWYGQTFAGSTASWSNVSVTLGTAAVTPPPSTLLTLGSSVTGTLAASQIAFYRFNYTGGALDINTLGSLLAPDNDTELALYNSAGSLLLTNDDIDFTNGNLLSRITSTGLGASGTYYIAVGGFNSVFGNNFVATSTSTNVGTYRLNLNANGSAAPEPGTLALVSMLLPGMAMVARRRTK